MRSEINSTRLRFWPFDSLVSLPSLVQLLLSLPFAIGVVKASKLPGLFRFLALHYLLLPQLILYRVGYNSGTNTGWA
jgi:hypothetical protein